MCYIVFYSFVVLFFSLNGIYCTTTVLPPSTTETRLPIATTQKTPASSEKSLYEKGLRDYDEEQQSIRQSRGMMMDDNIIYHDDHHHEEPKMEMKEESKAAVADPWEGYYDFIINEGSFKFWAAFQLVTAALLIYSAFAAVYYAKFNVITTDYDYYDDFYGRGRENPAKPTFSWAGLSSQTFQRIMDAISSKKYS
ncbi:uncharacterized protein LOC126748565 [Anthonomus grandis grandis]|uniref:uncharacterized protein LOC126748565 n=1 Tax=Anthonomus grandis grandis TaxID=2921223 RepID=UPI002165E04C|nr:uncharacterized protein LOC126748565 [Anthonomus grandis grandis]